MKDHGESYERLFRQESVWKAIFSMAIPALLTIIIMVFYNMADMFFIAQLGDTARVASVSIISPVFNIIMALATMIGVGGSAIIAGAFGAGSTSFTCAESAIGIGSEKKRR